MKKKTTRKKKSPNWNLGKIPVKSRSGETTEKKKTKDEIIAELELQIRELKGEKNFDVQTTVARGIELTQILEQCKEWYRERDEIIENLLSTGKFQFEYEGTILTLEDTFADKNKRWKSVPCNRYEIEITEIKGDK